MIHQNGNTGSDKARISGRILGFGFPLALTRQGVDGFPTHATPRSDTSFDQAGCVAPTSPPFAATSKARSAAGLLPPVCLRTARTAFLSDDLPSLAPFLCRTLKQAALAGTCRSWQRAIHYRRPYQRYL